MEHATSNYLDQERHPKENLGQTREVVVFVGPEGSGKTLQAKLLAQQTGLPFLTYGDVVRETAENDRTFLGDECRRIFEDHDYIELSVLKELISRELRKKEYQNGVVIDGALRIPGEVESFEELLILQDHIASLRGDDRRTRILTKVLNDAYQAKLQMELETYDLVTNH